MEKSSTASSTRTIIRFSREETITALKEYAERNGETLPDGRFFVWSPSSGDSICERDSLTTLGVDH